MPTDQLRDAPFSHFASQMIITCYHVRTYTITLDMSNSSLFSYIAITHDVHHPYRLFINVWIRCKSDDLIIFQWYYQYHPTILIVTFKLKTLEVSVTKCMHDNNETHSLIAISISLIVSPLSLELFASCDVAVSLLPATMHIPLAEQAISQGYETRLLLESVSSPLTP